MLPAGPQHQAQGKRNFVVASDSKHDLPEALNLLARDFNPPSPGKDGIGDFTYIATDKGWLQLATVIDLFSPRWWAGDCSQTCGPAW